MRSHAPRLDVIVLLAAAVALPCLATLQYRWLAELRMAQQSELQQSWHEAVTRSADVVNDDLSAFYAAVLDAAQLRSALPQITMAITAWRGRAVLSALFDSAYGYQGRQRLWISLEQVPAGGEDGPPAAWHSRMSSVPYSATWIAPAKRQSLPAIVVNLDPREADVEALLVMFRAGACEQLLRVLADRHFGFIADPRLAIVDAGHRAAPICSDPRFDASRRADARAPIFHLKPMPAFRAPGNQRGLGIVMSQAADGPTWALEAQHGETLAGTVRRVQARNLWMAAVLELIVVAAVIAIAMGARRARRTAQAHVKFSAAIGHELRTPLAAIKVLAQNQARGFVHRNEQIREYGDTIAAEADRLHGFVERVLQFSSGRSETAAAAQRPVDFKRVVADALAPLRDRIATAGLSVETVIDPAIENALGDEAMLTVAVRNLVHNALEHAEDARMINISVRRNDRSAVIAVADDGAGVPVSDRRSLFEPFARGSRARVRLVRGHGLGLAIVQDVARAHGGRAWYASREKGAVFAFTVALPGSSESR